MKDQTCRSRWNFSELVSTSGHHQFYFRSLFQIKALFFSPPEPSANISFCFLGPFVEWKNQMITAPIMCSPPMINCFRLTGRPPHLSEQTKAFLFQIAPLFSEFSSASNYANTWVIVKSSLVAGEGEACMSSPHSVRPYCALLIFWKKKKKKSIIHGRQDFAGWLRQH